MKKVIQPIVIGLILIFAIADLHAQGQANSLLIVSFQKVRMGDMAASDKLFNEKMAPVLNSMVDDGMLRSWGLFNHAWGDEWNVNVWYVVDNMEAFTKFWQEYVKRLNDKAPGAFEEMRKYIMEHKDNIYSIQNQYPVPPQQ